MSVVFFGFVPGERPDLPLHSKWREASAADTFPSGAQELLLVVHLRSVAEFVAWRGEATALAVVWVPKGESEPDDFWEDFFAIIREGHPEDEESFRRYVLCPRALVAGEAVQDIPAEWFVERSGPPRESDIAKLPECFTDQHAAVLADTQGRAEVIERLRDRSSDVCRHFFPRPEAITAWLRGAESPEILAMAKRSPFFRSLIREQSEILIDANLLPPDKAADRLCTFGIDPPRLVEESEVAPSLVATAAVRFLGAATIAVRDVADRIADFAANVVADLIGQGMLVRVAVRGSGHSPVRSGGAGTTPSVQDAIIQAKNRLKDGPVILSISTFDAGVQLRFSLVGDRLEIRVLDSINAMPPRMRFLKSNMELFFIDPEQDKSGWLFRVNAEDLHRAEAAGATQLEFYY